MAGSLNVNDLIIRRSDRSGVAELSVTIHEFPANAPSSFTPARDAYTFWYRPRREKGDTWVTVPELGLSHHHISRNHVLVSPPSLPHHGEWERADGTVVNFGFSPRFFEALAERVGLSDVLSKRPWHHFFAMDQRIEAVCLKGWPTAVVSRGRVVSEGGELKAARGSGEFIPRGEPEPVQTATRGPSDRTALKGLLDMGRSR